MSSNPIRNMLYISRCHNTFQRQRCVERNLIPSEMMLISTVCRQPGLSQREILQNLGIDKSRASHLLKELEVKGYVQRITAEQDARSIVVFPTEKALEVYPRIHENHEGFLHQALAGLSEKEILELTRLTEIIRKNAGEAIRERRNP